MVKRKLSSTAGALSIPSQPEFFAIPNVQLAIVRSPSCRSVAQ
jgi:hypothetical protein